MLQGITAHFLAKSTYPLKSGETALIHAAAGGVGQLLVQVARMCGARVLATTSSEEKAQIAKEAGADEVILYSQVDFVEEVRRLTDGKGVDVVYDGVGKKTFLKGLDCLKPRGMMVTFGNASGAPEAIEPRILVRKGSLFLTRPSIGHYLQDREDFLWRANDVFNWLATGTLRVQIDKEFPLEKVADAHRYMESGATKGKVLLIP
jgi:NADPH2:quinone reductase